MSTTLPQTPCTLMQAIARMEGFYVVGSIPQRLNNPGDLAYGPFTMSRGAIAGNPPRYARFVNVDAGWSALRDLLTEHYLGMNLAAAINKYAPPVENQTNRYVELVCQWTGMSPETILDSENIG